MHLVHYEIHQSSAIDTRWLAGNIGMYRADNRILQLLFGIIRSEDVNDSSTPPAKFIEAAEKRVVNDSVLI